MLNVINHKLNYPRKQRKYVDIAIIDYINFFDSNNCSTISYLLKISERIQNDIQRRIKYDDMNFHY